MLHWRSARAWLAACCVGSIVAIGCSTQTRPQATKIAEAGAAVAEAAAKTHQDLIESTVHNLQGQYLLAGLSPRPAPTTVEAKAFQDLTSGLALRALALHDLARVYRTLGQLAAYDAGGEVEGRLNNLTDSINAFGTALKKDQYRPINQVERGLIGRIGGTIAAEVQAARIRALSKPIRERVVVLRDLLRQQQFIYQSLQEDNADEERLLATQLFSLGLGEHEATLRALLESYGFKPTDAEIAALIGKGGDTLRTQLVTIYSYRRVEAAKQQGVILESAVQAMDTLIDQHEQLERSADMSPAALADQVANINRLLADYKRWHEADQAATRTAQTSKES